MAVEVDDRCLIYPQKTTMQSVEISSSGGSIRVAGLSLTGGSFAWWGYVGDTAEDPGLASDMLEVTPVQGGLELSCTENWSLRARYCVLAGVIDGEVVSLLKVVQRGATLSYPRSIVVGSGEGSVAYVTFNTSCTVLGNCVVSMSSGVSYKLGAVEAYGGGYRFSVTSTSANESFVSGNYGVIQVAIGSGSTSLQFTVSVYQLGSSVSSYLGFGGTGITLQWGDSSSGLTSGSGLSISYGASQVSSVQLAPDSGVVATPSWYSWYDVQFTGVYLNAQYTSGLTRQISLLGLGDDYVLSLGDIQLSGGGRYTIVSSTSSVTAGTVTVRVGFPWLGNNTTSAWSGVLVVPLSISRGGVVLCSGQLSYSGFSCEANVGVVSSTSDAGVSPSPYPLPWQENTDGPSILLGYTQTVRWSSGFTSSEQVSDYDVNVTVGSAAGSLYTVRTLMLAVQGKRVSLTAAEGNPSPWPRLFSGSSYGASVSASSGSVSSMSLPILQEAQGWSDSGAFYFNGVPADVRASYNIISAVLYLTADASARFTDISSLPADAKAVPGVFLCSWERSLLMVVPTAPTLTYPSSVGFTYDDTCYMLWGFALHSSTSSGSLFYHGPAGVRFSYNAQGSSLSSALSIDAYQL